MPLGRAFTNIISARQKDGSALKESWHSKRWNLLLHLFYVSHSVSTVRSGYSHKEHQSIGLFGTENKHVYYAVETEQNR
jgi:hypothetical protein